MHFAGNTREMLKCSWTMDMIKDVYNSAKASFVILRSTKLRTNSDLSNTDTRAATQSQCQGPPPPPIQSTLKWQQSRCFVQQDIATVGVQWLRTCARSRGLQYMYRYVYTRLHNCSSCKQRTVRLLVEHAAGRDVVAIHFYILYSWRWGEVMRGWFRFCFCVCVRFMINETGCKAIETRSRLGGFAYCTYSSQMLHIMVLCPYRAGVVLFFACNVRCSVHYYYYYYYCVSDDYCLWATQGWCWWTALNFYSMTMLHPWRVLTTQHASTMIAHWSLLTRLVNFIGHECMLVYFGMTPGLEVAR